MGTTSDGGPRLGKMSDSDYHHTYGAPDVSDHASSADGHGGIHLPAPSFDDVLWTLLFLVSTWVAGKLFRKVGMPALVGEIAVGVTFGPHVFNIAPMPQALMLYGELGLMLLVLEAGLDVDIEMLKLIGARGVGVAVSGSLGPLLIAFLLAIGPLGLDWKAGLALGCTLAPTSMGIALNVLKAGKVLNTPTGQLIIAAAVLDDVIALILLAELQALEHPNLLDMVLPVATSVGLMLGVGWLAIYVVPRVLKQCVLPRVPPNQRDNALLGLLFFLAFCLVPGCHQLGSSHLLGAFLAGLSFCSDEHVHHAWTKQVKRLLQWLLRIFFAATIGFEVPVREFVQVTTRAILARFWRNSGAIRRNSLTAVPSHTCSRSSLAAPPCSRWRRWARSPPASGCARCASPSSSRWDSR